MKNKHTFHASIFGGLTALALVLSGSAWSQAEAVGAGGADAVSYLPWWEGAGSDIGAAAGMPGGGMQSFSGGLSSGLGGGMGAGGMQGMQQAMGMMQQIMGMAKGGGGGGGGGGESGGDGGAAAIAAANAANAAQAEADRQSAQQITDAYNKAQAELDALKAQQATQKPTVETPVVATPAKVSATTGSGTPATNTNNRVAIGSSSGGGSSSYSSLKGKSSGGGGSYDSGGESGKKAASLGGNSTSTNSYKNKSGSKAAANTQSAGSFSGGLTESATGRRLGGLDDSGSGGMSLGGDDDMAMPSKSKVAMKLSPKAADKGLKSLYAMGKSDATHGVEMARQEREYVDGYNEGLTQLERNAAIDIQEKKLAQANADKATSKDKFAKPTDAAPAKKRVKRTIVKANQAKAALAKHTRLVDPAKPVVQRPN